MQSESIDPDTQENVLGKYAWFKPSKSFVSEWNELSRKGAAGSPLASEPHAEMMETETELVFRMELPGIRKEGISVWATEERIEVAVEEGSETEKSEPREYVYQCRYSGFRGSYMTPAGIDTGRVAASFRDGVLEVRAMKSGANRKKKVEIG